MNIGDKFGKWTVIGESFVMNRNRRRLCRCECGTERPVVARDLASGASRGCIRCRKRSKIEDLFKSKPKYIFKKLKCAAVNAVQRCRNINNPQYDSYGGRGIEVRFASIPEFITYLFSLPGHDDANLLLDRVDNEGHYEAGNLRFVTNSESQLNQRSRVSTVVGNRYNRWAVIGQNGHDMWICRCECGLQKVVRGPNLRNNSSKGCRSCGVVSLGNIGTEYFVKHRFAKVFRKLKSKGISWSAIARMYMTSEKIIRNSAQLEAMK